MKTTAVATFYFLLLLFPQGKHHATILWTKPDSLPWPIGKVFELVSFFKHLNLFCIPITLMSLKELQLPFISIVSHNSPYFLVYMIIVYTLLMNVT